MKISIKLISLLLIWLLVMLFSHDFIAEKITANNFKQLQLVKAGNNHFKTGLLTLDESVKSFEHHWQETPEGLKSKSDRPEVSIELSGFVVKPTMHQTLNIVTGFDSSASDGLVKIEFSNQLEQIYYDSNEFSLNQLSHGINLIDLQWTVNNLNDPDKKISTLNWLDVGSSDALVLRFYLEQGTSINLVSVAILQSAPKSIVADDLVGCKHSSLAISACLINNNMRYVSQGAAYQQGPPLLSFDKYVPLTPWILLVMAWLLTMFIMVRLFNPAAVACFIVCVVFLAVVLLHQSWIMAYTNVIKWLAALVLMRLFWVKRHVFILPHKLALPIWVGSIVLASGMWILSGFNLTFLSSMPGYFLWAIVQQLLIGPVISSIFKFQLKTSNFLTACLVGVLFSMVHAPNHVLMLVTLFGGVAWSYAWLRYENIYANAFSHALLALLFYQLVPAYWLGSARIGVFF